MSHLSSQTFVDLLDGTVAESSQPHLATCASCRQQLEALRVTWQAALETEVPEPSPLFWDHLSTRISEAIAAEPVRSAPWWEIRWMSWQYLGVAGLAALVLAIAVTLEMPGRGRPVSVGSQSSPPAAETTDGSALVLPDAGDDPSLGFMADLAGNVDWDAVGGLGLAHGDADRAVVDLNADERAELERLLREALGPAGSSLM